METDKNGKGQEKRDGRKKREKILAPRHTPLIRVGRKSGSHLRERGDRRGRDANGNNARAYGERKTRKVRPLDCFSRFA